MDKRLSKYLQGVESQLGGLSEEQRLCEVREMQQHIEAIIARLVEGGLSREEATEAALSQFGPSQQLGRELRAVAPSREPLWRSVLGLAAGASCAAALSSLLPLADELALKMSGPISPGLAWWQYVAWSFVLSWPVTLASGAVAGFFSPRRGARSMLGLACALFLASFPLGLVPTDALTPGSLLGSGLAIMAINIGSGLSLGALWGARQEAQVAARSSRRNDAQRV